MKDIPLTRQEVQRWADDAGLSSREVRDHLALATALMERNHSVEVASYRITAIWEGSPPMSSSGWFLRLPFGFFSLEGAQSEEDLRKEREGFLGTLYEEAAGSPPTEWVWESQEVPQLTWRRWVDAHQVERLMDSTQTVRFNFSK